MCERRITHIVLASIFDIESSPSYYYLRSKDSANMSVTGKVFVRKSRKGNVQVVAREHYLRDDLPCGAASCPTCPVCYSAYCKFCRSLKREM